jgi:uncharacterized membrane protein YdjX (TVP38/TMEM64 family)
MNSVPNASPGGPAGHDARSAPPDSVGSVIRRLGPAGPLALLWALLPAIGGFVLLGTLNIVGPWLRSHQDVGVLLYVLMFAVSAGLALLPTYAQAILGGWAFGFAVGFPAALGGFLGGALIGYAIARWSAGDRVVRLVDEHPRWKAVYDALLGSNFGRTLLIVTLLRLPPNSPFAITNLVLASTRTRLSVYTLGTLVGMAPRTAVLVFLAAGLKELSFARPGQTWLFIAGIVITLIVVAVIGQIAHAAITRVTAGAPAETA